MLLVGHQGITGRVFIFEGVQPKNCTKYQTSEIFVQANFFKLNLNEHELYHAHKCLLAW